MWFLNKVAFHMGFSANMNEMCVSIYGWDLTLASYKIYCLYPMLCLKFSHPLSSDGFQFVVCHF